MIDKTIGRSSRWLLCWDEGTEPTTIYELGTNDNKTALIVECGSQREIYEFDPHELVEWIKANKKPMAGQKRKWVKFGNVRLHRNFMYEGQEWRRMPYNNAVLLPDDQGDRIEIMFDRYTLVEAFDEDVKLKNN